MSRITPENDSPSPASQVPIDSSTGNSLPSRRSATSSTTDPASLERPVRRTRAMPSACAARSRSGMITANGRPTTSSARQPNISSAPRFHDRSRPSESADTIASIAASVTPRKRSSEARRASSARLRSITRAELRDHLGDALEPSRLAGALVGDEELQHRDQAGRALHRHGNGLADARAAGGGGPVEAGRVVHLRQHARLPGRPDQAGQPDAAPVARRLAGGAQVVEAVPARVPGRAADEDLAFRQPHLPHRAAGEVAHRLEPGRQHVAAGLGLAEGLEDELEEAPLLLGAHHLGAVAHHHHGDRRPSPGVADQGEVKGAPDELLVVDAQAAGVDLVASRPWSKTAVTAARA